MKRPTVLVLHASDFGHEVAAQLQTTAEIDVLTQDVEEGTHPAFWPTADVIVLAGSTDRPRLVEMIEESAFAWRLPWIDVQLEPTVLRCGPTVIPGRTACHGCFRRRRRQHGLVDLELPGQDVAPVSGYAPFHVSAAVALCRQAVHEATSPLHPTAVGGTVRTLDLVDGDTARNPVVAIDRCPRCRPRRSAPTTQTLTTVHARLVGAAG